MFKSSKNTQLTFRGNVPRGDFEKNILTKFENVLINRCKWVRFIKKTCRRKSHWTVPLTRKTIKEQNLQKEI